VEDLDGGRVRQPDAGNGAESGRRGELESWNRLAARFGNRAVGDIAHDGIRLRIDEMVLVSASGAWEGNL
jgi:hypothetical protein